MAPLACQQQLRASLLPCRQQQAAPARASRSAVRVVRCRAQRQEQHNPYETSLGQKLAAGAAAALLSLGSLDGAALANEFDLMTTKTPTEKYVLDDADVLSKSVKGSITDRLKKIEAETGYRIEVATLRRLEFENDAFAFGDKLIERWYPSEELGTKKGILLVVTTAKDGALTGGPAFLKAIGDDLIDSVVGDNLPVFTEQEKYNEAVTSSINRIEAKLRGQEDPGGPVRADKTRKRTYKTKDETDNTRAVTGTVVLTLLFIAFVVPMLQFFGYTSRD